MSTYTPGPWTVCKDSRDCDSVRAKGGFVAFGVSVQHYGDPIRFLDEKEEAEANARLIAAAPEMLEALKTVYSLFFDEKPVTISRNEMRELIAKAEGRA